MAVSRHGRPRRRLHLLRLLLCAAGVAAASAFYCVDGGALSRTDVCWDVDGRRTLCQRLSQEMWNGAWADRPLWADFGYYDANGDFQTLVEGGRLAAETGGGDRLSVRGAAVLEAMRADAASGSLLALSNRLYRPYLEFGGRCGDGILYATPSSGYYPAEQCDDGNSRDGDGCSGRCYVEPGYICANVEIALYGASVCTLVGDHYVEETSNATAGVGGTLCRDEGEEGVGSDVVDIDDDDGAEKEPLPAQWRQQQHPRSARLLQTSPDVVNSTGCGDVFDPVSGEQCDDGNLEVDDGCDQFCEVEPGYACYPSNVNGTVYSDGGEATPSVCVKNTCGDGVLHPTEQCDDGNTAAEDGCSGDCEIEDDYDCFQQGGVTTCLPPVCGDGRKATTEQCDDGNVYPDDGCGETCRLELGGQPYTCFVDGRCAAPPCSRFADQGSTICVPALSATAAPAIVTAVPATSVPTAAPTAAPATAVPSGPAPPDAKLVFPAGAMSGFRVDAGPCGVVLNGRTGCCQHLSELDHYGYASGLRDLTQCGWPHTGYVFVANATCEASGYYTIVDEEECATAAMSLRLADDTPFYMTDNNMTGPTMATVNLTFPTPYMLDGNRNFSGVYDQMTPTLYKMRNGTGVPSTAYIAFTETSWKLGYGDYKDELLAGAWGYASATLLGNWTAYDTAWPGTFQERRRQVGSRLITSLIGYVDSNPDDWERKAHPIVTAIGGSPNGCLYKPHTSSNGRLVLQDADTVVTAARCTSQDRCLCRVDPFNTSYGDYTASITAECSSNLHQLYCKYPCTASYLNATEHVCLTDADCGVSSRCLIPQARLDAIADLERRLAARQADDSFFCFRCQSVGEIQAELDAARTALRGTCTQTGFRAPPCLAFMRKVYRACRDQPVAYIPWAPQITPPAAHCQPLWWRHRTFDSFYEAYRVEHGGAAYNASEDDAVCWSAAPARAEAYPYFLVFVAAIAICGHLV